MQGNDREKTARVRGNLMDIMTGPAAARAFSLEGRDGR